MFTWCRPISFFPLNAVEHAAARPTSAAPSDVADRDPARTAPARLRASTGTRTRRRASVGKRAASVRGERRARRQGAPADDQCLAQQADADRQRHRPSGRTPQTPTSRPRRRSPPPRLPRRRRSHRCSGTTAPCPRGGQTRTARPATRRSRARSPRPRRPRADPCRRVSQRCSRRYRPAPRGAQQVPCHERLPRSRRTISTTTATRPAR